MLNINIKKLIPSIVLRGMNQAHIGYDIAICKGSEIPAPLKKSIKENASNFFDGGSEMQYIVFRVPNNKKEPSDATSKIVQMIKTNFLDGDPTNLFTTSEVQVGYIEDKKLKEAEDKSEKDAEPSEESEEKPEEENPEEDAENRKMFYVLKFKIEK